MPKVALRFGHAPTWLFPSTSWSSMKWTAPGLMNIYVKKKRVSVWCTQQRLYDIHISHSYGLMNDRWILHRRHIGGLWQRDSGGSRGVCGVSALLPPLNEASLVLTVLSAHSRCPSPVHLLNGCPQGTPNDCPLGTFAMALDHSHG